MEPGSLLPNEWLMIILSIGGVLLCRFLFRKTASGNLSDTFLSGRKVPGFVASLSTVATNLNANDFLGMSGMAYAESLLLDGGVAVMPGCSFGQSLAAWVRISLTKDDSQFVEACNRIVAHYRWLQRTEATATPRG